MSSEGRHSVLAPEGLLLIGGQSTRFLPDKMKEPIEGRPLYLYAIEVLAACCSHVWVATGTKRPWTHPDLPAGVTATAVPDAHPGQGPLEGIRSVMARSRASHLLVLAGDLPRVRSQTLECLLSASPADVVCARDASTGQLQPLCALWSTALLPSLTRALQDGQRGVQRFLSQHVVGTVDVSTAELLNVNRPSDMPGSVSF